MRGGGTEKRPREANAAGLNAFVFAFTTDRLASNTAVRPNWQARERRRAYTQPSVCAPGEFLGNNVVNKARRAGPVSRARDYSFRLLFRFASYESSDSRHEEERRARHGAARCDEPRACNLRKVSHHAYGWVSTHVRTHARTQRACKYKAGVHISELNFRCKDAFTLGNFVLRLRLENFELHCELSVVITRDSDS